jgi:hypothetical protein
MRLENVNIFVGAAGSTRLVVDEYEERDKKDGKYTRSSRLRVPSLQPA